MSNELTLKDDSAVSTDILSDFTAFENAQRIGKMLIQSKIIPERYQNNLPDVMVAMEIAARIKLSPIIVMQNLNIIKGRPSWSSKYIIAALTASRVVNFHYELATEGTVEAGGFGNQKKVIPNLKCRAIANDRRTGEEQIGPWVSMSMAVREGWYGKDGSKWQTMPDVMVRYRAATFFASVYYPELSIGIDFADEIQETPNIPLPDKEIVACSTIAEPLKEVKSETKPKKTKKQIDTKNSVNNEPEVVDVVEPEVVDAENLNNNKQSTTESIPLVAPQEDNSDEWSIFED